MSALFVSGAFVDLILALVLAEAIAVIAYRFATGGGPEPIGFVCNLLAGAFLLFALREALSGAHWIWVAASLSGALVAHAADLLTRWSRAPLRLPPHMIFRAERLPRAKRHIAQKTKA
ncbi:MAG: hypothetical protein WAK01_00960 [Methylocystis sp.]